jgi:hypothetical protein
VRRGLVILALPALLGGGSRAHGTTLLLRGVWVGSGGPAYAGDNGRFATVSPNGDGSRDAAVVHFRLAGPARVTLGVFVSGEGVTGPRLVAQAAHAFGAGTHELRWKPRETLRPRTYMLRLAARDRFGAREVVGTLEPGDPSAHVVRVLGIDAGFTKPSYPPGSNARLVVSADEPSLTLPSVGSPARSTFLRSGARTTSASVRASARGNSP